MRILTVFYSLEGNCRALAEVIREAVGGDVEALRPEKEIPSRGFLRFLIGGWMTLFGKPCPNRPLADNVADFDLIFIGTPVWAFRMSPPVRRFLAETDWTDRTVALYAMHGGGPGKTLRAMRELIESRGGRVVSAADFLDLREKNADATRAKAAEWAKDAVKGAECVSTASGQKP